MSDFAPTINVMQTLPPVVTGPNGTICITPATLHELVAMSDAIQLGVMLFILGMALGGVMMYYRIKLDEE